MKSGATFEGRTRDLRFTNASERQSEFEPLREDKPDSGPVSFDPKKCDHGETYYGAVEWDYCENCRPDLVQP